MNSELIVIGQCLIHVSPARVEIKAINDLLLQFLLIGVQIQSHLTQKTLRFRYFILDFIMLQMHCSYSIPKMCNPERSYQRADISSRR